MLRQRNPVSDIVLNWIRGIAILLALFLFGAHLFLLLARPALSPAVASVLVMVGAVGIVLVAGIRFLTLGSPASITQGGSWTNWLLFAALVYLVAFQFGWIDLGLDQQTRSTASLTALGAAFYVRAAEVVTNTLRQRTRP